MSNYLPPPMRPDPEIMANAEGIRRDLDEAREAAYAELAKSWSTGRTPAPCGCVQALRDEAARREAVTSHYRDVALGFLHAATWLEERDAEAEDKAGAERLHRMIAGQLQEPRPVPR